QPTAPTPLTPLGRRDGLRSDGGELRRHGPACTLVRTTGFTLPEVSSGRMMAQAAALIACDCANSEKPLMLACFQIKSLTSIVVSRPAEYPSEVRTPPRASVASA